MAEAARTLLDKWLFVRAMMLDSALKPIELRAGFWLMDHLNLKTGRCFPSFKTLEYDLRGLPYKKGIDAAPHIDTTNAKRAIRGLVQRDWFTYRRGSRKDGANVYAPAWSRIGMVALAPPIKDGNEPSAGDEGEKPVACTPLNGGAHAPLNGGADAPLNTESETLKEKENSASGKKMPSAGAARHIQVDQEENQEPEIPIAAIHQPTSGDNYARQVEALMTPRSWRQKPDSFANAVAAASGLMNRTQALHESERQKARTRIWTDMTAKLSEEQMTAAINVLTQAEFEVAERQEEECPGAGLHHIVTCMHRAVDEGRIIVTGKPA